MLCEWRTHEAAHEDVGEELGEHELRVAQVELHIADAEHPHLVPGWWLQALHPHPPPLPSLLRPHIPLSTCPATHVIFQACYRSGSPVSQHQSRVDQKQQIVSRSRLMCKGEGLLFVFASVASLASSKCSLHLKPSV